MESVSESKANTELVAVDNSATNQEESSSLLNRPDAPKKHNSIFLNSFNFYLKSNQNSTKELTMKLSEQQKYILALEKILEENQLSKPSREEFMQLVKVHVSSKKAVRESLIGLLRNLKPADLQGFLDKLKSVSRTGTYAVSFRDFGIWTISTPTRIATVGSQLCTPCLNIGKSRRYDILKDLTGCIYPGRLTLLVGPPGSGKSTFLKAVCGRRIGGSDLKFDGQIFYNDEDIKTTDKFLLPKVSEYIEQNDTHAPTLTVEETLAFAWECSSGGHHSYCIAKDEEAAKWLDAEDATKSKVMNVQYLIGLEGCKNTYVGDGTIRGVSGGQKRRVTLGEMFVTPRRVKMMDSISNGLDSATTFDIVKSIRGFVTTFSTTSVVSLLQVWKYVNIYEY